MRWSICRRVQNSVFALVLILTSTFSPASDEDSSRDRDHDREILVCFEAGVSGDEIRKLELLHGLLRISEFSHLSACHYGLPAESVREAMLDVLNRDARVKFTEPNYPRTLQASFDPWLLSQWGLSNTGQRANGVSGTAGIDIGWTDAMEIYRGEEYTVVAVVDSGVALDHPEFLTPGPEPITSLFVDLDEFQGVVGADDDGNGFIDDVLGWDFFDDDNVPLDEHGHGTLVASIIGGIGSNGAGGEGIAPHAEILPIRILNDFNRGNIVSDFIAASTYAQRQGARIINCSFGGSSFSLLEQLQVLWLAENDIILVCAAGNGGTDGRGDSNDLVPQYPASYGGESIISVAAVDQHGRLAPFSNFGLRSVDLAAPGVDIFGADVSRSSIFFEDFEGFSPGWTNGQIFGNQSTIVWRTWRDTFGNAWLTDSDVNFFGGQLDYAPNTNSYAVSPIIDLRNVQGAQLAFDIYHVLPWDFLFFTSIDLLLIEASVNGFTWDVLDFAYGRSDLFQRRRVALDLSQYENQLVNIRFRLVTDGILQGDGVYIDNVEVTRVDLFRYDGTQYRFANGTSFAAPMVSGVAAMIWSQRPDLSVTQVRQALLDGVMPQQTLNGWVASGGMLNARRSLEIASAFPMDTSGLFIGAKDLDQGWKFVEWFGAWNDTFFPWIFHADHGWIYIHERSTDQSIWMFDPALGWLFTSAAAYPNLYSPARGSWIFYFKGTNPREFVNLGTSMFFSAE